jgi:spore coat protein U-like protein
VFTRTSTVNTPAGANEDLDITTSAATSAQAGTYTDTVTLTIASL